MIITVLNDYTCFKIIVVNIQANTTCLRCFENEWRKGEKSWAFLNETDLYRFQRYYCKHKIINNQSIKTQSQLVELDRFSTSCWKTDSLVNGRKEGSHSATVHVIRSRSTSQ